MSKAALTLDDVCALIAKATTQNEIVKELIPALKKLDKSSNKSSTVLDGKLQNDADPLAVLEPESATVGYLFILNARCSASNPDLTILIPHIHNFIERFDLAQLRLVPEQVIFFAKSIVALADDAKNMSLAVLPLRTLLLRYTPPGILTTFHGLFLQVVQASRDHEAAREVINRPIIDVDTSAFPIKYHDHLLYHYLGGSTAALLRDIPRAVEMLEICVSAPGTAVSGIQVDAYKKLVLIGLLAEGKLPTLPQYTSSNVQSVCKSLCGPYIDYAHAYASHDKQKLRSLMERHHEVYEKDHNLGLISLCDAAFRRRAIQKLTETFITLSLVDIAIEVDLLTDDNGLRETESELLSMMAAGEIFGSIDRAPGGALKDVTVTFTDDPEPYTSHKIVDRVTAAINGAAALDRRLVERDWAVGRSKDFVTKAYNAAGNAQGGMGGLAGDEDMGGRFDWDGEDA
ncbi:hypothetical protein RQP46_004098 [Phenoliferia psychrophenolica]